MPPEIDAAQVALTEIRAGNSDVVAQGFDKLFGGGEQPQQQEAPAEQAKPEAKGEKPQPQAKTQNTAPPEGADDEGDAVEEQEEESTAPEDAKPEAKQEEEAVELADTLEGLAEQLGQKPDEFARFIKVKVGDKTLTLAELQAQGVGERVDKATIDNERKQYREALERQVASEWQPRFNQLNELLARLEQQAGNEKELTPQELDALFQQDPAQYVKTVETMRQRREARQAAEQLRSVEFEKARQANASRQNAVRQAEREKLLEKFPDWKDPVKAQQAEAELVKFIQEYGYTAEDFAELVDHRAISLINDAMKWRQSEAKKPETLTRLKALPRMVRPGTRTSATAQKRDSLRAIIPSIRKRGDGNSDAVARGFDMLLKR